MPRFCHRLVIIIITSGQSIPSADMNTFLPYEVIMATAGHLCLCLPHCFSNVTVAAVLLKEGTAKKVSLREAESL